MPSIEYHEGRQMEKNEYLHKFLIEKFGFDEVDSDGATTTKTDIFGIKDGVKTFFSVKNVSGKNTQVHLTTLKKFCLELKATSDIFTKLEMWLGDNETNKFKSWAEGKTLSQYETDHNRLKSSNINEWHWVELWMNEENKKQTLPRLLIESLNDGEKSKYIIWVNKKSKKVKIVDAQKLIDYISVECNWVTMASGTTMRCVTPKGEPILWMQMKGNHTDYGYNHSPQFHIVENWPEEFVIDEFSI
jgi:hypothetical protein